MRMNKARAFLYVSIVIATVTFLLALAAAIPLAEKMRGEGADEARSGTLRDEAREKFASGDVLGARALLDRVLAADPGDPLARSDLSRVLKTEGDYAAAIANDKIAIATAPDIPDLYYNVACYYALARHKDDSLDWLARAFAHGFGRLPMLRSDPDLALLHGDARYEVAARTGRFPDGVPRVHFHRASRAAKVGEPFELDLVVEREVPVADAAAAAAKLTLVFEPRDPLAFAATPDVSTVAEPVPVAESESGEASGVVTLRTRALYRLTSHRSGIIAIPPVKISDGTRTVTSEGLELEVAE